MMATTHAIAGAALGTLVAFAAPEYAVTAPVAGFVGGLFPDLDLYAGHRKTLHYPVYFSTGAALSLAAAAVLQTPLSVAAAVFLLAAAVHSVMDAFGGGLELRPWHGTSERAVYDHARGRWIAPRRGIRYDGAPEDLALACALALPSLLAGTGRVPALVAGALALSAVYVALRKPLVDVAERLVALAPDPLLRYVPERFVSDLA